MPDKGNFQGHHTDQKSRPSDKDTGYPWGKAGKEAHRKRTQKKGYLWKGHKPEKR